MKNKFTLKMNAFLKPEIFKFITLKTLSFIHKKSSLYKIYMNS